MKSPLLHLIGALVLLVVSIIGYGIWYAVLSNESAAVAALGNQINTKTETANRIASARAALVEIAGDEAVVQSYFVPETGVVAFIDGLEMRGRTQGATVSVLSVSSNKTGVRPTLTFALTIKGTFDAVMRTIGAIEYSPYALSFSGLSVSETGKNEWNASLNVIVGSLPMDAATSTLATTPSSARNPLRTPSPSSP